MCGILGGNQDNWNYKEALLALKHRGPDGQRLIKFKNIIMGFARLAIIDLSEQAMQPMVSRDGRYAIVFNGEIYDYNKVRKQLEKKGYYFNTDSDTEVLLYSFIEWKEKVMNHVDGIFAFAIFDIQLEKLYLFRDRCGVKPLYFYQQGNRFAFSSELKGIEKLCTNEKFELDNTALYDYHTYLYIPAPKTMYKNIYKLPPAHYLIYDTHNMKIAKLERYWKVRVNVKEGNILTEQKLISKAEELRYHVNEAVKRQLVADVPVGVFFSGGVDSSVIASVAHSHMNDIMAYTIGFQDRRYDESVYAREIANILHINYKEKIFDKNEYNSLYGILKQLYDEPYADMSAYPTYLVSKYAREDVTVVLTGDGADELFGGYSRYQYAQKIDRRKTFSNRLFSQLYLNCKDYLSIGKTQLDDKLLEDIALLAEIYQYQKHPNRKELRRKYRISKDYDDLWYFRKFYHKDLPVLTRMRYLDFMTYLNGDILTKVDRASMAVSLEARVPFLDREVIDFAFSLTQTECNPSGQLKGILKLAYQKDIPRAKLDRKKQGFSIPFAYASKGNSPQESIIENIWKL